MERLRLYLAFGITSTVLQFWAFVAVQSGKTVPRLSFMLGPCGLYFLVMALHPHLRRPAHERTAVEQRLMFGLLTACAILAWWNHGLMASHGG